MQRINHKEEKEMSKKGTDLYFIHYVIMLVLVACGWLLPAGEVITPMGMKAIGIFAGLIYGWIFIDLIWPSLLGLVLLSFTGRGSSSLIVSSSALNCDG